MGCYPHSFMRNSKENMRSYLHSNHSCLITHPDERGNLVSIYIFYNSVCDSSCPVLVMSRLSAKIKYLFVSC